MGMLSAQNQTFQQEQHVIFLPADLLQLLQTPPAL